MGCIEMEGFRALKTLESKFLAEVNDGNRLQMHDRVRDFGRARAWKQSPRRIGNCDRHGNVAERLKDGMEVRGIVAAPSHIPTVEEKRPLENLSKIGQTSGLCRGLKLPVLDCNCFESTSVSSKLLKDLVWLRCYDYPHTGILPTWSSMEHLRVLEINGHYTRKLWQMQLLTNQIRCQETLKKLDLSGTSLQELPASAFGIMRNLQVLRIGSPYPEPVWLDTPRAGWLYKVMCLPESLGQLIVGSSGIESLPTGVGRLTNLQELTAANCPIGEVMLISARDFDLGDSKKARQFKIWTHKVDHYKCLQHINPRRHMPQP